MPHAETSSLEHVIGDAVKRSSLAKHFHGVTLDESDSDETNVVRVLLSVDSLSDVEDGDLTDLVRAIEEAVFDIDSRYPSVRFSEAA